MGRKPIYKRHESFIEFYEADVIILKKLYPDYSMLDGGVDGRSTTFSYFKYQNVYWKVDGDTLIEKLDLIYKQIRKGQDPFKIIPTKSNKNNCLVLSTDSSSSKKFYAYQY